MLRKIEEYKKSALFPALFLAIVKTPCHEIVFTQANRKLFCVLGRKKTDCKIPSSLLFGEDAPRASRGGRHR